jgi:hypothetical protein
MLTPLSGAGAIISDSKFTYCSAITPLKAETRRQGQRRQSFGVSAFRDAPDTLSDIKCGAEPVSFIRMVTDEEVSYQISLGMPAGY